MRKLIVLILCIAPTMLFFACKKSSSTPAAANAMTATVSSKTFTANSFSENINFSGGDSILYITGLDTVSGHQIDLKVLNYKYATRTFPIDSTSVAAADYSLNGSSGPYSNATTGQIVLTQITPNIKGTFYFTTADTTVITSGTFTVPTL